MPQNSYQNDDLEIQITYLPDNFYVKQLSGTKKEGKIEFHSKEIIDEIFGPYISFEYTWKSIPFDIREADGELFSEIERQAQRLNIGVFKRKGEYINSHFNQYLIGSRIIVKKNIRYSITEFNGVFYCDHTEREVHFKFIISQDLFYQWKDTLIQIIHSVKFHY